VENTVKADVGARNLLTNIPNHGRSHPTKTPAGFAIWQRAFRHGLGPITCSSNLSTILWHCCHPVNYFTTTSSIINTQLTHLITKQSQQTCNISQKKTTFQQKKTTNLFQSPFLRGKFFMHQPYVPTIILLHRHTFSAPTVKPITLHQ